LKTSSRVETLGSLDRRPQNLCDSVIVDAAILSIRMVPRSVEGAWAIMSLCSTPSKLSRVDVQPCGSCGVRLKLGENLIQSPRPLRVRTGAVLCKSGVHHLVRLHVGDSNHEAIGTVLVSIRVDSVKNRGGSLTMQNDTVAESACRSLRGIELSTTAEGKYEVRWSVKAQRDSGPAGKREAGGTSPFPLPRQDRPAATK
jgi:hypothetical protein